MTTQQITGTHEASSNSSAFVLDIWGQFCSTEIAGVIVQILIDYPNFKAYLIC